MPPPASAGAWAALGGLKSTPAAINNSGQIVGSADTGSGAADGFLVVRAESLA